LFVFSSAASTGSAILKRDEGDVAAHPGATPLLPDEIKNLFAQAGN